MPKLFLKAANEPWIFSIFGFFGCLLWFPMIVSAQQADIFSHAQALPDNPLVLQAQSIHLQQRGMILLGSWAGLNILTGSMGTFKAEGSRMYFHQMNAAWNVVNAGIAFLGYRGTLKNQFTDSSDILTAMHQFDQILLINAGLDILYISGGIWLAYRGLKQSNDRWKGYGQSIILQGSFLLAFGLFLHSIHQPLTKSLAGLETNYFSFHLTTLPTTNFAMITELSNHLLPIFQLSVAF